MNFYSHSEQIVKDGVGKSVFFQDGRPLITFALIAYNQEQFICEAVEGAFSQTYSPLEIILSDDCSKDRTFDILKEMVSTYKGSHTITLNRNKKNIGIGNHVNKVFEMSSGEIIVLAAGDDISTSNRVDTIFNYWIENGRPSAIQSDYIIIDDKGVIVDGPNDVKSARTKRKYIISDSNVDLPFYSAANHHILGCSSCYTKDVFEFYGPLKDVAAEDNIFSFRASLLNGILFVGDKLVKYRIHDNNVSVYKPQTIDPVALEKKFINMSYLHRFQLLENHHLDIKTIKVKSVKKKYISKLEKNIKIKKRLYLILSIWWELKMPLRLFYFLFIILPHGTEGHKKWAIKRLLPLRVFINIRKKRAEHRAAI